MKPKNSSRLASRTELAKIITAQSEEIAYKELPRKPINGLHAKLLIRQNKHHVNNWIITFSWITGHKNEAQPIWKSATLSDPNNPYIPYYFETKSLARKVLFEITHQANIDKLGYYNDKDKQKYRTPPLS